MYILDTDHLTILQRGGPIAAHLKIKLGLLESQQVVTTIITYEEQTRGWLTYIAKSKSINYQIQGYHELQKHLNNYLYIPVIGFNEAAGLEFQNLRKKYPRLGTMDLKIAAITIVNQAILLTRNLRDFGQIIELKAEDWTIM